MKVNARAISACISAAVLSPAFCLNAQEMDQTTALEEMTVTATRSARNLDELSRSVSIVTRQQIEERQPIDVLELLEDLPGVSSASNGGLAGQLVIRGFSTQGFRAPLFVDGDRFRGRNTIEYSLFNPAQLERIEVVRGPASSIYGTDSLGGIVNVISRRPEANPDGTFTWSDNSLALEYATVNNLQGGRLQLGGAGNGIDLLLGVNYREAGNYESPAGDIPNSGFEAPGVDLRLGYAPAQGHRLELSTRYSDIKRERAGGQFAAPGAANGPGVPQRLMTDRSNEEEYLRLGYFADDLFGGRLKDVEATLYRRDLQTHVNVVPNAVNPSTFVDVFVVGPTVTGGHIKGVFEPAEDVTVTVGGDWYIEERDGTLRSVRGGPRNQRDPDTEQLSTGVFALTEWLARDNLRLSASLRYDRVETELDTAFITDPETRDLFSGAGDTVNDPVTGAVGAVWDLSESAIVFANVGTSFRAPSVTELAAVGTGTGAVFRLPNSDVDPERGINYEIGLRLRRPDWRADAVAFYNDLEDLIDRDVPVTFNGEPAVQMQNIGEAEVYGLELSGAWQLSDALQLAGNATYTRGTDTTTDTPLAQIMPWNGNLSLRWDIPAESAYVEGVLQWALEQDRINPSQERESDDYAVLNLSAGYSLGRYFPSLGRVELRASVYNLFDERYRLPTTPANINFPDSPSNPLIEPGRNLRLALEVGF